MSRAGVKAFNTCEVKVVEFKDYVFASQDDANKKEVDRVQVRSENPSEDTRVVSGIAAVLHCPLTEDPRISIESQYSNHPTRLAALDSLRLLAGDLVCRNCRFSSMSAIEVAQEQAVLARAEAEKIEALTARRSALIELQSIDPDFKIIGE